MADSLVQCQIEINKKWHSNNSLCIYILPLLSWPKNLRPFHHHQYGMEQDFGISPESDGMTMLSFFLQGCVAVLKCSKRDLCCWLVSDGISKRLA